MFVRAATFVGNCVDDVLGGSDTVVAKLVSSTGAEDDSFVDGSEGTDFDELS